MQIKLSPKIIAVARKATILSFVIGAILVFGRVIYSDSYYAFYGAKEPQPAEGKIYEEYFNHGAKVFLTESEAFEAKTLLPLLFVGQFAIAAFLNERWKQFKS